jgi:hypothetical protein
MERFSRRKCGSGGITRIFKNGHLYKLPLASASGLVEEKYQALAEL